HLAADVGHVVADDLPVGDRMAGLLDALRQGRARLVVRRLAGVGYRQHRDAQRHEGARLVNSGHGAGYSCVAPNVLQLDTVPFFGPGVNQPPRGADEPWVKASGTTRASGLPPCAMRCSRSSPIAAAVCIAASTSPGSMNFHFSSEWCAHTPAKQSACS